MRPLLADYLRLGGWVLLDAMPAPEAPVDLGDGRGELVAPDGRSVWARPACHLWPWLVRDSLLVRVAAAEAGLAEVDGAWRAARECAEGGDRGA